MKVILPIKLKNYGNSKNFNDIGLVSKMSDCQKVNFNLSMKKVLYINKILFIYSTFLYY